ncbi:hypothetical protein [Streptomyces sp. NPDC002187]|uniref:hypothetical protein n=1 Tax=Streptomyces sp. NPDC002187 TaxID=3364637 RepID=UPI0036792D90
MSAGIKRLAEVQGFGAAFGALQRLRVGRGNPHPEDILHLPRDFRRSVLSMTGEDDPQLTLGLAQLIALVEAAPQRERDLLRMAFNFDLEFGDRLWTARVTDYAVAHGVDERKVREKVDTAILQLLIRTRTAAEQYPESVAERELPAEVESRSGAATEFFNQDYVRNSRLFVEAWSSARTVDLCGFGHNRMLVSYSAEIIQLLGAGGRLRVLLQDPEGRAVVDANYRSSTPKASEESVRHQHRAGLATLASLRYSAHGDGEVLVRAYDIMPPFTAYFFDAETDANAKAFIWFWSWRQASSQRPGFALQRIRDPLWFERFYGQFTFMWNDPELSKPLEIQ